jgi:IclR family KDG regulon transcriptional repressor
MEILLRKTGETVCLVCPRGLERVTIEVMPSAHELAVVPTIGSAVPIYTGATGRVFMAYLQEVECARIIKQTNLHPLTSSAVSDPKLYMKELEQARQMGYAQMAGEVTIHSSAIAAPVFNSGGEIIAAISLRGPETRLTTQRGAELAPAVVQTAQSISEELGYGQSKTAAVG